MFEELGFELTGYTESVGVGGWVQGIKVTS